MASMIISDAQVSTTSRHTKGKGIHHQTHNLRPWLHGATGAWQMDIKA